MDDLEQLVRDGLRERAERVDTTAPLVARARRTARRRRGARAVVAAAAAVVVVVGGTAILGGDPRDTSPAPAPTTDGAGTPVPMAPQGWRTEQWHDLAVDVPAHWGYGSAPIRTDRRPTICDDRRPGPYVGRPVMASDLCTNAAWIEPEDPYVWLGADLEPGIVEVGDGLVQETVEVAGTTLTVAGDDPLRRRILASARRGGPCPSELARASGPRLPVDDTGDGLLVCGYGPFPDRRQLLGAQLLGSAASRRFVEAYASTDRMSSTPDCPQPGKRGLILLQAGDRQWAVDIECSGMQELGEGDRLRPLTIAAVEPWATGFVSHVFHGPSDGRGVLSGFLIGPMG